MGSVTPNTMTTGDYPWLRQQHLEQETYPSFHESIWLEDIQKRVDELEIVYAQLKKEEEIREKSTFVQELYDQYKVALMLSEDPDE